MCKAVSSHHSKTIRIAADNRGMNCAKRTIGSNRHAELLNWNSNVPLMLETNTIS